VVVGGGHFVRSLRKKSKPRTVCTISGRKKKGYGGQFVPTITGIKKKNYA